MTTRQYWVVVILIIIAVPFAYRFISSFKPEVKKRVNSGLPLALVQEVLNEETQIVIEASGRLSSKNSLDLYSEVNGVLQNTRKEFRTGVKFSKGEEIIKIDDSEIKAQLFSQRSDFLKLITGLLPDLKIEYPAEFNKWEAYHNNFDIERNIADLPKTNSSKEKYFISGKNIYTQFYNIKNLEARLAKYHIRAPFDGVLIEALVNPGGMIRSNQKVGVFSNTDIFELELSIKSRDSKYLKIGDKVLAKSSDLQGEWVGKISRINGALDNNSQTISVFVDLMGKELKSGMYLDVLIESEPVGHAFRIPRNIIHNNSYIYVVKDSVLQLKEFNPIKFEEKSILVDNLEDGDLLLIRNIIGAYDGMKVNPSRN